MNVLKQLKAQLSKPRSWVTPALVLFFLLLSLVYFAPATTEGLDIYQPDVAGASGTAQDVRNHYEQTGETAYWTNSLFGGMPMYQIDPSYPSLKLLKGVQDFLTLQYPFTLLPSYSWLLFALLIGFYLFGRSLSLGRGLSALGAVMWTFSSYFIILIVAGHIWKLTVLAFIPPTIAGIVYIYRGKYLLGAVVTTFFAALQLMSNHIQMSYYFAFLILALVLSYSIEAIRAKRWKHLGIATMTLLLSALLSIAMNGSNLYHTYEYTQETMRGGSELAEANSSSGKGGGLDKEYITAWSYGKAETLTLLVPNAFGGASGRLSDDAKVMQGVSPQLQGVLGQMNRYWGDQPFTAGPVYVGAFVLFLAILGCFVVRGGLKWALLGVTLLTVALSWGHNLMWLTDFFIDYFPLYNKFRTVSSILVVAEFTLPTLAVLALLEFLRSPRQFVEEHRVALWGSLAVTGGLALVLALLPSSFIPLLSEAEAEMFRPHLANPDAQLVISTLKDLRASILSADALRSVAVIALSLGICWAYLKGWLRRMPTLVLLIAVTLVDLWMVDKRYLKDDDFVNTQRIALMARPTSAVDRQILQDKDPHYRVFNTSVATFNDATTSYNHRSIGGYHAAKLSRYQDIIEHQLSKGTPSVLNMLDVRYIIGFKDNDLSYQRNDEALGAAWLIKPSQIRLVASAREAMDALSSFDPSREAIVEQSEGIAVPSKAPETEGEASGSVKLVEYSPGRVTYDIDTPSEQLLVMSEIYYPHGWVMTIDGKEAPIKRANYLLRAALVPAGRHRVELSFSPSTLSHTETLAFVAQMVLLLGFLLLVYRSLRSSDQRTTF